MEKPKSDAQVIRDRALKVPLAGHGEILDEETSLAVLDDLIKSGSSIPAHLQEVTDEVIDEIVDEIGDVLPTVVLRGIVSRGVRRGGTQAISDTGQSYEDIEALQSTLGLQSELVPKTSEES